MAGSEQDHGSGSIQLGEDEWRNQLVEEHLRYSETPDRPRRPLPILPILLIFVMAAVAGGAVLLVMNVQKGKVSPNDTDDLGQGVNNASGLRGHLVTRWEQGKAQYQLKIEPIDPRANDGFAIAAGSPTQPISINVRVLDSSGFALCGKEILLPYDPAKANQSKVALPKNKAEADRLLAERQADVQRMRAEEKARESGRDVFQDIGGSDGKIEALWAQGVLPCSPDQYRRFDYWDLTTNFPTMAEQQALLDKKTEEKKQAFAEQRAAARKAIVTAKPASAFYIEGDDHITAYEPGRGLVTAGPGRSFFIDRKADQAVVAAWAADSALIHYKCDQHGVCALRHGGSAAIILGRMNE
jgi:hypothetical protein